ncbi:TetR/AcrR family transcriptional regulator [Nocardia sp. NPDC059246]|uniref:TetR/AcrR family transcriptional regulator n=1 Tax=unclassified Nocardia TaxID=2637762 RepID=UPI0036CE26E1
MVATNGHRPHRRGDARDAILMAARTAFAVHGLHDASIKAIALDAKVSETLVYRYFGSKSGLFDESIVQPGRGFVQAFLDEWEATPVPPSTIDIIRRFVDMLLGFARENEGLLLAWAMSTRSVNAEFAVDSMHGQGVRRLAAFAAAEADKRGLHHPDLEMAVACSIGLVLSMVLLEGLLFPEGDEHRDADRIANEVVRFIHGGFFHPYMGPDTAQSTRIDSTEQVRSTS